MADGTSPTQGRSFELLLQSILDGQTETFRRMEQLREVMATKDDINRIAEELSKTVTTDVLNARLETEQQARSALQTTVENLAVKVTKLERSRVPDWFWPAATIVVMSLTLIVMTVGLVKGVRI